MSLVFTSKRNLLILISVLLIIILGLGTTAIFLTMQSESTNISFSISEKRIAMRTDENVELSYRISASEKVSGTALFDIVSTDDFRAVMSEQKMFDNIERAAGSILLQTADKINPGKYFIRSTAKFGSKRITRIVPMIVAAKQQQIQPVEVIPKIEEEEVIEEHEETPVIEEPIQEETEEPEKEQEEDIPDEVPETEITEEQDYIPEFYPEFEKTVREKIQDVYFSTPEKSKEFCDSFDTLDDKEACIHELAQLDNKKEFCNEITTPEQKDSCLVNFALLGDYSVCPLFSNEEYRSQCQALAESVI